MKSTKNFTIRLDHDQYITLRRDAHVKGVSVAAYLRLAIDKLHEDKEWLETRIPFDGEKEVATP